MGHDEKSRESLRGRERYECIENVVEVPETQRLDSKHKRD